MKMLINLKYCVIISLSVLSLSSYGQTAGERINAAGIVYVEAVNNVGVYVSTNQPSGIADWSSVTKMEAKLGDTLSLSDSFGKPIGDLLYYKAEETDLVELINQRLQSVFAAHVDGSVKFETMPDALPNNYFLLSLAINPDDAGQMVIGLAESGLDERRIYERLRFSLVLSEKSPEMKKPKKILTVASDGTYCKVAYVSNPTMADLDLAVSKLFSLLTDATKADLEKMRESKKKTIIKKLSK